MLLLINMNVYRSVCVCVYACVTNSTAESKDSKCFEGPGENLGPLWPLLQLGPCCIYRLGPSCCCTGCLPARGQICPQPYAHTHTCAGRERRRLKQCEKKTLTLTCAAMCFSHTQRSFAVICLFVCFMGAYHLWAWQRAVVVWGKSSRCISLKEKNQIK